MYKSYHEVYIFQIDGASYMGLEDGEKDIQEDGHWNQGDMVLYSNSNCPTWSFEPVV